MKEIYEPSGPIPGSIKCEGRKCYLFKYTCEWLDFHVLLVKDYKFQELLPFNSAALCGKRRG